MARSPDDLTEKEIARRRDEAVRRALNTPPKLHNAKPKRKRVAGNDGGKGVPGKRREGSSPPR